MKTLKTFLRNLILAFAILVLAGGSPLFAALTSTIQWQIIGGGSTNNGALFDPSQTAGMLANFTATAANTSAPIISSPSYSFVSGDVGKFVYIGPSSGWIPGEYKVTAVNLTGATFATLDAAIGHVTLMTILLTNHVQYSLNTAVGCASTASPTAGVATFDLSRSTSNAATNATFASAGASAVLTDGSSIFTPMMVGNGVHITGSGTGAFGLTQWFIIIGYTSATSVTTDRTTNNGTAMVAGTGFVGGGVALPANINSASAGLGPIAGNYVWFSGSISPNAATDTWAIAGTTSLPIVMEGYGTYMGDGFLGNSNSGTGLLIKTNMPTITYTTGTLTGAAWLIWANLNFLSATSATAFFNQPSAGAIINCSMANSNTTASSQVVRMNAGTGVYYENDDFVESGVTTNTTITVGLSGTFAEIYNCRFLNYSTGAGSSALSVGASVIASLNHSQFFGAAALNGSGTATGMGINVSAVGALLMGHNNTASGFVSPYQVIASDTAFQVMTDSIFTDGTNGVNASNANNAIFLSHIRYRNNTTNITTPGAWTDATNFSPVTSGSVTDFTTPASDFRLVTGSPAIGTGNASNSIGALMPPAVAGGQTVTGGLQ